MPPPVSTFASWGRRHADALLGLLWPPLCPACGERAERPRTHFCEACWNALRPVRPGRENPLVPGAPHPWAAFSVDALFLRILTTSKYSGFRDVGRRLGEEASGRIVAGLPPATLVPIPLTAAKRRERGFNQTLDFARDLARRHPALDVQPRWIVRRRGGRALAGMPREARTRAIRAAFAAGRDVPESGAGPVLLVDDVVTTGSTAAACAAALEVVGIQPLGVVAMGRAFASSGDAPVAERTFLSKL